LRQGDLELREVAFDLNQHICETLNLRDFAFILGVGGVGAAGIDLARTSDFLETFGAHKDVIAGECVVAITHGCIRQHIDIATSLDCHVAHRLNGALAHDGDAPPVQASGINGFG